MVNTMSENKETDPKDILMTLLALIFLSLILALISPGLVTMSAVACAIPFTLKPIEMWLGALLLSVAIYCAGFFAVRKVTKRAVTFYLALCAIIALVLLLAYSRDARFVRVMIAQYTAGFRQ